MWRLACEQLTKLTTRCWQLADVVHDFHRTYRKLIVIDKN